MLSGTIVVTALTLFLEVLVVVPLDVSCSLLFETGHAHNYSR